MELLTPNLGLVFWTAVSFGIVLWLLSKYAWGPITSALKEREESIKEALELMEAWGFQYKTNAFTWVKKNKIKDSWFWGMGRWTRSNAEICILGVKGKPKRIGMGVHSVIDAKVMKHSAKPPEVRDKILELMGDIPRLEMFAREAPEGWDVFGNEAPGSISIGGKQ